MGAGEILAAAAERDVDIIAYPSGQADVPAVPKIHQIERAQRRGEVFRQPETEQHGDADNEVAVSREVKKKLEGVAIDGGKDAETVKLRGVFKHGRHPAVGKAA